LNRTQSSICGLLAALVLLASAGFRSLCAEETAQRDIVRIREGTKEDPWLRIDAAGHTAAVRALTFTSDSSRVCSGGLDKNVEVWNLAALRDLRRVFLRERTIRWQVARGLRGSIYALAAAPDGPLLAIGGYGAMGSLGEIVLVNPIDGKLVKVLKGHRQTVCALAFSGDGKWLGSMDTGGETRVWNRSDWSSQVLYNQDVQTYGAEAAAMIAKQTKLRPLTFLGSKHIVLPTFASRPGETRLRWRLVEINVSDPTDFHALDTIHYGMITALAATPDGTRLASADAEGKLYLWDRTRAKVPGGGPPQTLASDRGVLSMNFSPDGRTLVAGTLTGADGKSELQVWNTVSGTIVRRAALADHVYACAVSPDGKRLAYSGGDQGQVYVESMAGDAVPAVLRGIGQRIGKVAFAAEQPFYRVAFGKIQSGRGFNDYGALEETFDTTQLSRGVARPKPGEWLTPDWLSGGWTAKPLSDGTLQLFLNDVPRGTVTFRNVSGTLRVPPSNGTRSVPDTLDEGTPRCFCWIPDAASGQPFAIAVGTDVQDSIYICRLVERGACPILRHFRGHNDRVTSLGASRDLKYLVSGSADGTVRFWNLAGYAQGAAAPGRWGAAFVVQDGKLVANDVHPAGPLFGKGIRKGDVLTALRWPADRAEQSENHPEAMLEKLAALPWGTQVVFEYSRKGAAQPAFQLLPAWPPLATLFAGSNGEWAFWTPAGYYDASMNGHRIFGWQVNRGLERLPDFYRANQFYKELERPRVMERLLPTGSLRDALDQAAAAPKLPQHEVLPAQIAATPRIEILSPAAGTVVRDGTTKVKARVELPAGRKMLQLQVFANGVAGSKREMLAERPLEDGKEQIYQWDLALPADRRSLIQVMAGTDAPTAAFGDVIIERAPSERPSQRPELYVLSLGINRYGDAKINQYFPLAFPVADAEAVAEALRKGAAGLYRVNEIKVLKNEEVTPAAWTKALTDLRTRLKDHVQPDDLVIFFLAGHGIMDEKTKKYYYIGHDVTLADLAHNVYKDCISWTDFAALADVPCRKVVLLDTCHSGAVQPLRSSDLKTAVRELQADVIFSVTASTGDQAAAEGTAWRHGAFTRCLLEALSGAADQSRTGIVRLDDVVPYVKEAVKKLTDGRQTPTASPEEILRFTTIPLTQKR
jgi:WD40 repeat protein